MKRIFQLTASVIVFFVASGASFALVVLLTGGKYPQDLNLDVPRDLSDRVLDLELGLLPVLIGLLAAWGIIRFFRLNAVTNEIADTIQPAMTILTGYGRFVLIVMAVIYIVLGSVVSGLVHLILGVLAFTHFYRCEKAKEAARRLPALACGEEKGEDSPGQN